jgi:hypothetical protein
MKVINILNALLNYKNRKSLAYFSCLMRKLSLFINQTNLCTLKLATYLVHRLNDTFLGINITSS